MKTPTIIDNTQISPAAGQVIEWRGTRAARVRLATGLTLRLSEPTGLYLPEDAQ